MQAQTRSSNPVRKALVQLWPAVASIFAVSFFINVLQLSSMVYMMSVFDRVFTSRNEWTLLFLTILVCAAWILQAGLDGLRTTALARIGTAFDRSLADKVFDAAHAALLTRWTLPASGISPTRTLHDLERLRLALSGSVLAQITDALWIPLFVLAAYLIHADLAIMLSVAIIVVTVLGTTISVLGGSQTVKSLAKSTEADEFAGSMLRNSEVIYALGMKRRLQDRWRNIRDLTLDWADEARRVTAWVHFAFRCAHRVVPSLIFAWAAMLALKNEIPPGSAVVILLLSYRAMGPAASIMDSWYRLVGARSAYKHLNELFSLTELPPERLPLPRPLGHVALEDVTIVPPGARAPTMKDVSFELEPGKILGIIGPSGAGKSSLARALVGVWKPSNGTIRIDGAELSHWDPEELGQYLGYMPQDVELFSGTVAENISRFREAPMEDIIEAARLAGAHDVIQSFEEGYNTNIGPGGASISGGQRQRIALARALFGRPSILVLDEPNASLDSAGEQALVSAIKAVAEQGTTVVLVTHRGNVLSLVDYVLLLANGRAHGYGRPEDVLPRLGVPNVVQLPGQRKAQ
ncbi:MAG: type I secretion system permease/ATPase [Alsobacter sp.]